MNALWFLIGFTFCLFVIILRMSYTYGIKKSFQHLLSILIPIILSGTAIRIGEILLPESIVVSYYIAATATVFFYIILFPIITKEEKDRYRKISKQSRYFSLIIGLFYFWLISSFGVFFINILLPNLFSQYQDLIFYLILPIRLFWFFPNL